MRKLPSAWSIVWTDSTCCQLVLIAPMFFLFALMVKLTGTVPGGRGRPDRPVDPEFATLALACTGAMLAFVGAFVALRVARIRGLFDAGEEVEAMVTKVSRSKGGSTLRLEYERAGTSYRVRSSFQRSSRMPTFTAGDRVTLLVDRMNPKRAVPMVVYGDTAPAPLRAGHDAVEKPGAAPWPAKALGLQVSSGTSQPARRGDER